MTLLGIALILISIVAINAYMRLDSLREKYEALRMAKEQEIEGQGFKVIKWDMFRDIKGKRKPAFPESLSSIDGDPVNLCGFMSPINQFSDVSEFMLLPVPITCYFCDSPPMRDIVQVKLAKRGRMVEEPIVVGGLLKLSKEEKPKFFTTIDYALWNEAIDTEKLKALTDKATSEDHKKHLIIGFEAYMEADAPEEPKEAGFVAPQLDESKLLGEPAPAAPKTP